MLGLSIRTLHALALALVLTLATAGSAVAGSAATGSSVVRRTAGESSAVVQRSAVGTRTVAAAPRAVGHESRGRCSRTFNRAVRAYVETARQRDSAGFNRLLHPDVTIIFANGSLLSGKHDSAAFIRDFFADPGWSQSFSVLDREVEGCRTGFVLFDSVYRVPAQHRESPLVIGVTFTRQHGRWLVLHNQDSTGPASR